MKPCSIKFYFLLFQIFAIRPDAIQAQFYDSSIFINAALSLYYELPSGLMLSTKEDSIAKNFRFRKVITCSFIGDTLQETKTTLYDSKGRINSIVTINNKTSDTIILQIRYLDRANLNCSLTFTLEGLSKIGKSTWGFKKVFDSLQLEKSNTNFSFSMSFIDNTTANIDVSINGIVYEKRKHVPLFPFLEYFSRTKEVENIHVISDSLAPENGYLVDSSIQNNHGAYTMNRNVYEPKTKKILKHEFYEKVQQVWVMKRYALFYYNVSDQLYRSIDFDAADNKVISMDSLVFYSSGQLRSRRTTKFKYNPSVTDSLFTQNGMLLQVMYYDPQYFYDFGNISHAYIDTFYSYNNKNLLCEIRTYLNGALNNVTKTEYEYW
jgi:hypothetical protein